MKTVKISEFKARCIALLKAVQQESIPLMVTLRGEPLVVIRPCSAESTKRRLGGQAGSMRIKGDIVNTDFSADWDALQ